MQRIVGSIRNMGFLAIGAGIANEFLLFDVDAGTRVVIFDAINGVLPNVYSEGTHFKLPWQVSMVHDFPLGTILGSIHG